MPIYLVKTVVPTSPHAEPNIKLFFFFSEPIARYTKQKKIAWKPPQVEPYRHTGMHAIYRCNACTERTHKFFLWENVWLPIWKHSIGVALILKCEFFVNAKL